MNLGAEWIKSEKVFENKTLGQKLVSELRKVYILTSKDSIYVKNMDFHQILTLNLGDDIDEKQFAQILHQIDVNFFKSLKISDFFRPPIFKF